MAFLQGFSSQGTSFGSATLAVTGSTSGSALLAAVQTSHGSITDETHVAATGTSAVPNVTITV